ncbi:hypothetical protein [Parabacteroides sp. FAFU027]|uniref:hypothetical protein n=1 Tax=Parabacteroides sp. FAFU027 TaxID=2922715 RepID=UPI001FAFAFDF|nr:hypothetical protein [Parabacteroides sp. FAFU027]
MAESKNNVLTHGLSGKVGDLIVFRQRGDKTFVSAKPRERSGEMTDAQKAQQARFQEAAIYGKSALQNEALKKQYQDAAGDGKTPYNVAVADFLKAPNIKEIDLTEYTGKVGDKITVSVTDDFKVTGVTVSIYNADGSVVENGTAELDLLKNKWIFTATAENASLDGDKIVVTASDLPGNVTEKNESL